MPQNKLSIEELLIKYNISRERYYSEKTDLLALGFTVQQADKTILRGSSKKAVESVLKYYKILSTTPYSVTHEEIVALVTKKRSSQTLHTIFANFGQLTELGFCKHQIIAMVINGGAHSIKTVIESFAKLIELGFNHPQIVAMATNDEGDQAIKAVIKHFTELAYYGYEPGSMAKLAAYRKGVKKIQDTLADWYFFDIMNQCVSDITQPELQAIDEDNASISTAIMNLPYEFQPDLIQTEDSCLFQIDESISCPETQALLIENFFETYKAPSPRPNSHPLQQHGIFSTPNERKHNRDDNEDHVNDIPSKRQKK